ncbi:MAG: DUF3450 domain-containing protein [Gammaproteobacteria bacterium]|jgi:hypothetical protein|nr:DUF3450 domain-containing protein [Gammaproteobacteria bacterium]
MENLKVFSIYKHLLMLGILLGMSPVSMSADKVDAVVDAGVARADENKSSQKRVDGIASSTEKVVSKYKRELKVIDGLKVYNELFRAQIGAQEARKDKLRNAIAENAVVERQIFPLMLSMVEALEQFIELDIPFHIEERRERVANLKKIIGDAEVIGAEKLRKVYEAYQIETDFGSNLDSYREVVTIDGKQQEVAILRFGRVSLVYQSGDGKHNAVWDNEARNWVSLDATEYRNYIKKGLKIASKQIAPELFILPVSAAE